MLFRNLRRTLIASLVTLVIALLPFVATAVHAQDSGPKEEGRHGRKYKAPPQTSNIEITVVRGYNQKPIINAAVVFHPVDASGKDEGFLEMKTDPDGKAKIDVIPTGSSLRVQVIATGFATYAEDFRISDPEQKITVAMQRPRQQVSTYVDETGKASTVKPGVQEPVRPKLSANGTPIPQSSSSGKQTSGPASGAPNTGGKQ